MDMAKLQLRCTACTHKYCAPAATNMIANPCEADGQERLYGQSTTVLKKSRAQRGAEEVACSEWGVREVSHSNICARGETALWACEGTLIHKCLEFCNIGIAFRLDPFYPPSSQVVVWQMIYYVHSGFETLSIIRCTQGLTPSPLGPFSLLSTPYPHPHSPPEVNVTQNHGKCGSEPRVCVGKCASLQRFILAHATFIIKPHSARTARPTLYLRGPTSPTSLPGSPSS